MYFTFELRFIEVLICHVVVAVLVQFFTLNLPYREYNFSTSKTILSIDFKPTLACFLDTRLSQCIELVQGLD